MMSHLIKVLIIVTKFSFVCRVRGRIKYLISDSLKREGRILLFIKLVTSF